MSLNAEDAVVVETGAIVAVARACGEACLEKWKMCSAVQCSSWCCCKEE
jgi:hypothetical protein